MGCCSGKPIGTENFTSPSHRHTSTYTHVLYHNIFDFATMFLLILRRAFYLQASKDALNVVPLISTTPIAN